MRYVLLVALLIPLCAGLVSAGERDVVKLRACDIDITAGAPRIPSELAFALDVEPFVTVRIIHLVGPITPEMRAAVTDTGAEILTYIPHDSYIVRGDASVFSRLEQLAMVDWMGPYQPYYKLHENLYAVDQSGDSVKIYVKTWRPDQEKPIIELVEQIGSHVFTNVANPSFRKIGVETHSAMLRKTVAALAQLDEVAWIEEYPDYALCNDSTAWVMQSGLYGGQQLPIYAQGIRGQGQIVAVMDTGADPDMCFFYDASQGLPGATPNPNQRKILAYIGGGAYPSDWDPHGHGTHTAGTIAGDNFATPGVRDAGDGMAPAAKLVIQDYGDAYDVHPPDDEYAALNATFTIGARIHSNSWGWPGHAGEYHNDSQEVDTFIYDIQDFLPVYAAGNEGSNADSIRPPGTAKNVMTIGATDPGAGAENMASFSSHGPTDDGRRKPDISICGGYSIYSADSDGNPSSYNCSTTGMAGTSMATPGAAGATALVRQYFVDGFYPTGVATPGNNITPSAALMKAAVINSGDNMTGNYTADVGSGHGDIPTNGQGWGRINLDSTLFFMGDEKKLYIDDHREGISTGDSITYNILNLGGMPFEATLVWTDYPGNPSSSVQLVNDLDLTMNYNNVDYKGNVYSGGQSTTGGSYDRLNNVECVQINDPESGLIQLTVSGYSIPQGVQNFAIVVTGNLSFSDGVVTFDRMKYGCAHQVIIRVSDGDLLGAGTQDIAVSGPSHPEQTYTLVEEPVDSGLFIGTFTTTTGTPGPWQIRVQEGDTITATYIDADDGHGGYNIEKTDDALIDCTGPVISNVVIEHVEISEAVISWTTDEPSNSIVYYGPSIPPAEMETVGEVTTEHTVHLEGLLECVEYHFSVGSADVAGNETIDNNGGNYYTFTTLGLQILIEETMDADPGWTISPGSQWAWGTPLGSGGDPSAGYTGTNVYGYNLAGQYPNSMPAYYLTTPALNCSNAVGTSLSFYRWLGVESNYYDHAIVSVSIDGTNWTMLWQNGSSSMQDTAWTHCEYDISSVADGQSTVYIRWTMGTTDGSVTYSGWNIDDVLVSYAAPCNAPNLRHDSHDIDDSAGNNDGMIDYGESINMPVTLFNSGIFAPDVTATIQTESPFITITQNAADFGDIDAGTGATGIPAYAFTVSPTTPDMTNISFTLNWTSGDDSGVLTFTDNVHAPDLAYSSVAVLDQGGDNDGVLDPDETAMLQVSLRNAGSGAANGLIGALTSDNPTYVTIVDGTSSIQDIAGGAMGTTQDPHFTVQVSPSIPDPTIVNFTMNITGVSGLATSVTFPIEITSSQFTRRYYWDMETDPDWTMTGEWEWGMATGACGDPTGVYVVGYDLSACYTNMMPEYTVTTDPLNFSGFFNSEFHFQRWLGVENNTWDHARVQISTDGATWTTLWENVGTITDTAWVPMEFDISSYADGQPTVYLRWTMGTTDGSVTFGGWNIDEVEIWADSSSTGTPTPTPTTASTYTPTPTTPPTYTPTPVPPTNTPTPLPPTDTPIPPTDTPVPPTDTPAPPTDTPIPPTNTPLPPTNTPVPPTDTPAPPTDTPVPPTHTPTEPTNTPVPTNPPATETPLPGTPTPIPNPGRWVYLDINSTYFTSGDQFLLTCRVQNNDDPLDAPLFILLEVYGQYWFYPDWTQDLAYQPLSMEYGFDELYTILDFEWPATDQSATGINFFAALVDQEMTMLMSNLSQITFGFGQ